MKEITGIPASQGLAIGPAFTFERAELLVECTKIEDPKAEWDRFLQAQERRGKESAYFGATFGATLQRFVIHSLPYLKLTLT